MGKAQAAIEFLTTYGWALIVILAAIGALAYFGVLSPSKLIPEKCIIAPGFDCRDYRVTTTEIDIIVYNRLGEGMTVDNVELKSDAGSIGTCSFPTTVLADENITITCTNSDFAASAGSKVKVEFSINYTKSRDSWPKIAKGTIHAEVQQ